MEFHDCNSSLAFHVFDSLLIRKSHGRCPEYCFYYSPCVGQSFPSMLHGVSSTHVRQVSAVPQHDYQKKSHQHLCGEVRNRRINILTSTLLQARPGYVRNEELRWAERTRSKYTSDLAQGIRSSLQLLNITWKSTQDSREMLPCKSVANLSACISFGFRSRKEGRDFTWRSCIYARVVLRHACIE